MVGVVPPLTGFFAANLFFSSSIFCAVACFFRSSSSPSATPSFGRLPVILSRQSKVLVLVYFHPVLFAR